MGMDAHLVESVAIARRLDDQIDIFAGKSDGSGKIEGCMARGRLLRVVSVVGVDEARLAAVSVNVAVFSCRAVCRPIGVHPPFYGKRSSIW